MADNSLLDKIKEIARTCTRPDGSEYESIFHTDELEISKIFNVTIGDIYKLALQNEIVPERYARNQTGMSCKDQLRLHESTVVIIGLGGLGGAVLEMLVRVGVGCIVLVDGDIFEDSNLNRQVLCTTETLGFKKVMVASKRVAEINPSVQCKCYDTFFTAENSNDILSGADLAIDCLDNIPDRFILQDSCEQIGIPMVSAAMAGTFGQATTVFPGDKGLRSIYGEKPKLKKGYEAKVGTLSFTANYMAAVECADIVSILLTKKSKLRNHLYMAEIGEAETRKLPLPE
ncbi:MAG: HesA/MoeB/ThiF family protein [Desulfotalea sp.]